MLLFGYLLVQECSTCGYILCSSYLVHSGLVKDLVQVGLDHSDTVRRTEERTWATMKPTLLHLLALVIKDNNGLLLGDGYIQLGYINRD